MMPTEKITPAEPEDIPALSFLLNQLFEQEAEFTPDPTAQQRGLARIIADRDIGVILVARNGQQVIGMVNLLYTVSTALGERVALLEDMVVHPDQRNAGIGAQLLDAALHFAVQNGCRRITLLTDADNDKAQRFYRRHGFSRSPMIVLRRTLA